MEGGMDIDTWFERFTDFECQWLSDMWYRQIFPSVCAWIMIINTHQGQGPRINPSTKLFSVQEAMTVTRPFQTPTPPHPGWLEKGATRHYSHSYFPTSIHKRIKQSIFHWCKKLDVELLTLWLILLNEWLFITKIDIHLRGPELKPCWGRQVLTKICANWFNSILLDFSQFRQTTPSQ